MAKAENWDLPAELRPKQATLAYDLESVLSAVVHLRAEVPEDAFTASILGTERDGNGVVIGADGVVLTIGYLISEAATIWLTTNKGTAVPGHVLGYDQATGFGLVQALGRLGVPALERGSARHASVGDAVVIAGHGGLKRSLATRIAAKREFAGYWEYVLDEALFTTPAHPQWGGAALVGPEGKLIGIGSLLVQGATETGEQIDANMVVPIDLLEPIYQDLMRLGRADRPARPWLGMYTTEGREGPTIVSLTRGGPASKAEVHPGDRVLAVAGMRVRSLADLYRKIWALGPAGTVIPLTLQREGDRFDVEVGSADRDAFMKKPHLH
ncbi:MAG TPA: S1C family serine protease [Alphaproteobacteria bacterium]|nr:S1C family serine protease [Alphaproteobacteria bacterium]